jgi:hypothetical protein
MPWFVQVLSEHSNAAKLVEVAIGLRLGSRSTSVRSVTNFGIQVMAYFGGWGSAGPVIAETRFCVRMGVNSRDPRENMLPTEMQNAPRECSCGGAELYNRHGASAVVRRRGTSRDPRAI